MLFTGLGRSVLGKTVPSVSSTAEEYSRPRAQFFPIRPSRPVNNIYILPARVANQNTEFAAYCPLAELAI